MLHSIVYWIFCARFSDFLHVASRGNRLSSLIWLTKTVASSPSLSFHTSAELPSRVKTPPLSPILTIGAVHVSSSQNKEISSI
ncbi:hypothetical protein HanXRQr2_Chr14g0667061 [Helianthus annuus]|uniref:Uncharacterized protein n=1 Tax=Helianthus annuus TaxID=4232 RepID=A0A9K3ECT5_HELAN|nr:hypothetical protein HanXRQr2_Chr14g0667061 [Helianthus annuus]KAJ0842300.1 hypothetical protein HanPSC8_Chr14g0640101 [Helianthus annuus]